MATQRIWRRVEAPGTFRGHALVADLHGVRWYAWEHADGTWAARRNDGAPSSFPSWTELRTTAERGANPSVDARQVLEASPMVNVRRTLGALVRAVGMRGDGGGIWVTVPPGYGRVAFEKLAKAEFPYDVRIMEVP